ASTVHHYTYYWEHILSPRCAAQILRDVTTPKMQLVLSDIARQNASMRQSTLHRLKSILSAVFKLAIQQGYRPGPNPVRDTYLPRVAEAGETVAYDLDTELAMLQFVPEPSRTVLAVAAFAGLRRGEIEGLRWEDYDGENLNIVRAMWQGIEGRPKSKKSKASVPVIAPLKAFLDGHHRTSGKPETGIMFKTSKNTPLSMNNLLNDQIRPTLDRCICGEGKADHAGADHDYQRDPKHPEWHGFHAFRRGLATNLHALGVDDLTIQRILRHSNVAVTQQCYIKTQDAQKIAAMQKLESLVADRSRLICNESAKASSQSGWVN
ncbi:MAG: tyrosine-type recombinase/integrase, partial [Candidatus Sulfotelmatobacter sp.]